MLVMHKKEILVVLVAVVVVQPEVVASLPSFSAKFVSNLIIPPMFATSNLTSPIILVSRCSLLILPLNSLFHIQLAHTRPPILMEA